MSCLSSRITENTLPTIDIMIKIVPSASDTKQPDVWEVSSTSMSNTSAEWNHRVKHNIWGNDITSTAN